MLQLVQKLIDGKTDEGGLSNVALTADGVEVSSLIFTEVKGERLAASLVLLRLLHVGFLQHVINYM